NGYRGNYCEQPPTMTNLRVSPSAAIAGNPVIVEWDYTGAADVTYLFYLQRVNDPVSTLISQGPASVKSFTYELPSSTTPGQYVITVYFNRDIVATSPQFSVASPCGLLACGRYGVCQPSTATCRCLSGYSGPQCSISPCDRLGCNSANTASCDNKNPK